MNPAISAYLGLLFLLLGAAALVLMLRVFGTKVPTEGRLKLVRAHRVLGWTFTLLYLFMIVIMVIKIEDYPSFSALQAVHITIGVALLPILGIKILIVRRYPSLHRLLPSLGITVFTLATVMITLGAGPYFLAKSKEVDTSGFTREELVAEGERKLTERCQKCHALDRVYDQKGRKTPELWEATVDRMVKLDPALAGVRDPIVAYLQEEFAAAATPEGEMLTGAALVEARCSKCHSLDRVYQPTKTEAGWRATVKRYAELLPDHIRAEEVEPIVKFLFDKRGKQADPEEEKRVLFEQHCGRCHNLSRALEPARENRISERRWGRTIRRMKSIAAERELGDLWSDEEAKTIASYLAAQYTEPEEGD